MRLRGNKLSGLSWACKGAGKGLSVCRLGCEGGMGGEEENEWQEQLARSKALL